MPASGMGEERLRSDAQVPYLYVAALDVLGIPVGRSVIRQRASPKSNRSVRSRGPRQCA